jgi:hypothetical protein
MKQHYCKISGNAIPLARVEALQVLGIPEEDWTCIEFAPQSRKKGVYVDLDSSFIIADTVEFVTLEQKDDDDEEEEMSGVTVLDKISGEDKSSIKDD